MAFTPWSGSSGGGGGGLSDTLASGKILVGSAGNVATAVDMSGQATIANTGAVTLDNAAVIAKVLTGYTSGAGTVASTDSILQAIQKLNGNIALKASLPTYSEIALRAGNNWGSGNTKFRRFTTVDINTGSDMTLAQSSTNGDSITINTTGLYGIYYNDTHSSSANFGVSVNANDEGTTNIYDIGNAAEKIIYATAQASSAQVAMFRIKKFTANDILYFHGEGLGGTNPHVMAGAIFLGATA